VSEEKVMKDEEKKKVVQKALREEYLKEIAHELNEEHTGDISVDEKGNLHLSMSIKMNSNDALIKLVLHLANQLADTKAELWLKDYKTSGIH
jgi:uncharacterized protein YnzC (UPF0291/DUF896 family)